MPSRFERANAIRALSMDAVQRANSGHPGAPMGMADIAEVLWRDFLKHNPANPNWVNRDRFVMSNGHGSMLVYSLLHLTGYALNIDDLKNFRQLHSKTPGHPEYGYAPGIETTTGPLGQGLANAVGFAIAEKALAAQFNREAHQIVDHHTYVFLGDGCLMEGISHEVSSLAGTLGLGKLIALYDDNNISIDGDTDGWFTDDTVKRFEAYGWQVIADVDGHDPDAIKAAIEEARADSQRPTLIACKTIIGFGAPNKQGGPNVHGSPLGDEEISAAREQLGWHHPAFEIPADIADEWDARARGSELESSWNETFVAYKDAHPKLAEELERRLNGRLPADFSKIADDYIRQTQADAAKLATRKASGNTLEAFGKVLPELLGGSADLAGSNNTLWSGSKGLTNADCNGNYIYYGVREFGMSAIMNGIALHGGFIPYGGTFLIFMEYARNAIRMAALMKQRSIFVLTHDSIGLGEDGPTHQPIEQLTNLRTTPNMSTWRPCDVTETAVAWTAAIERKDGPTALILTRQGVAPQARDEATLANVRKGGYILAGGSDTPDIILIATGSEVELAMSVREQLIADGANVRVVSMASADVFESQSPEYRESVLPRAVTKRIAIEAAYPDFWHKYVGLDGVVIGISSFGESAPANELFEHFGFTAKAITEQAKSLLGS